MHAYYSFFEPLTLLGIYCIKTYKIQYKTPEAGEKQHKTFKGRHQQYKMTNVEMQADGTNHARITVTNASRPEWRNCRRLRKKRETLQFHKATNLTVYAQAKRQTANNNQTK